MSEHAPAMEGGWSHSEAAAGAQTVTAREGAGSASPARDPCPALPLELV